MRVAVWARIDLELWEKTENPLLVQQDMTRARLEELEQDTELKEQLKRLLAAHGHYCDRPGWFGETYSESALKRVAYFSMEYGLGEALPLYAGGLGMLAGDHLKAASDLNVPIVALGLLYQEGYFRQMLDVNGWQQESYPFNDSSGLPIRPVQSACGNWLHVSLEFPGRSVRFRVWLAQGARLSVSSRQQRSTQ